MSLVLDIIALAVLLGLARRYPIGRGQPGWHLAPHVVVGAAFIELNVQLQRLVVTLDPTNSLAREGAVHTFVGELLLIAVWSGIAHGIEYLRRYRAGEADALRLRLELADVARGRAEADLRAFEAELNPKFLINGLRSAATLVETQPERGERLITEIGEAMRGIRGVLRPVTLGDEIGALAPFVALEQTRLDQEIVIRSRVPDDLLDAEVPPLALVALVREVLRSAGSAGAPITIDISAERSTAAADRLVVEVSRVHHGPAAAPAPEDDVLSRTLEHVRAAHAATAAIEVARSDDEVTVRLTLPWDSGNAARTANAADVESEPSPRSFALPAFLGAWFVAMGAIDIAMSLSTPPAGGVLPPVGAVVVEGVLRAALRTAVLYVAIRITRRGLRPGVWWSHAVAAGVFGVLNSLTRWVFIAIAGDPYPPVGAGKLAGLAVGGALLYAMVAGVVVAFEYARRYRSTETRSLHLRTELAEAGRSRAEAELRALKAELNPHFIGNALATATTLARSNPAGARKMLTRLADIVSAVVARIGTQEVTLAEEIEGLAPFIEVEQSRFGEQLAVDWEVDEDARRAHVPHMILQPLVENAVKHGLASRGGRIVVAGRRAGARLELSVRDDGTGLGRSYDRPRGVAGGLGLANARARLEQMYGPPPAASLDVRSAPEKGTIAMLTLPWR
jgi:LytS/YehU family sensor histidine kinase